MTVRINVLFFIVLTLLALPVDNALTQPLKPTLEASWNAYLVASRSGKESEIEKTMSSHSLCSLKNNLVSAQRSLTPDIIKSFAKYSPDTSKMDLVRVLANGDTAGLVYKENKGEKDAHGNPEVSFHAIKFVRESEWKVHAVMSCDKPMYQQDGQQAKFFLHDLRPGCAIDGKVKPAPALVKTPYSSALLDIFSYGYQAEVTVNGVPQEPVTACWSGVLVGGLCKGKNKIDITMTKTDTVSQNAPRIKIRRLLKNRTTREVFKFEPSSNIEGEHSFTIKVK